MARGGCLLSAILTFSKDAQLYRKVKNSREAATSSACAKRAFRHVIIGTLISIAVIVGAGFLIKSDDSVLIQVFGIILLAAGGLGALISTLHALVNSFYQLLLPRKSPGLASLALAVIGLAAAIIVAVVMMGGI